MTFWCGSGSGSGSAAMPLTNADADPAIFVIDLQDANKKLIKKFFLKVLVAKRLILSCLFLRMPLRRQCHKIKKVFFQKNIDLFCAHKSLCSWFYWQQTWHADPGFSGQKIMVREKIENVVFMDIRTPGRASICSKFVDCYMVFFPIVRYLDTGMPSRPRSI